VFAQFEGVDLSRWSCLGEREGNVSVVERKWLNFIDGVGLSYDQDFSGACAPYNIIVMGFIVCYMIIL